jgi:hypothetical protein
MEIAAMGRFDRWVRSIRPDPRSLCLLALCGLPGSLALAAASGTPIAVSPASKRGLALVEARCPTFSWTSVEGRHHGYELVVYVLGAAASGADQSPKAPQPVLTARLPPAANSWTPTLEACLAPGERYAWSIRALQDDARGEWSEPGFFEISAGLSARALEQAVALLRQEMAGGSAAAPDHATTAAGTVAQARPAAPSTSRTSPTKRALGTPSFAVDGSGNVSAASVSAGLLTGNGSGLTGVQAVTAGALAANGANCPAGQVPTGIDAAGNVEGCAEVTRPADLNAHVAGGDHDQRYLQLGGGTLTGPLTAPSFAGDGSALTGIVAASAQTLAANAGNCTPGTAPLGIDASGAAEDCFDVTTGDEFIAHLLSGDHDNRYLQLTGGTLTGGITAPSFSGNGANLSHVVAVSANSANSANTANQLSTDPGNCAAGSAARGISASGAAQDCFAVAPASHTSINNGDHDGRYLRQTGGTLTGPLTMNGSASPNGTSLTVDGPIFSRCPESTPVFGSTATMDRVGAWCIDHRPRPAATGVASVLNCHDAGMSVCSMEVIFACDAGNYGAGVNSCGAVTDNAGSVIRTLSIDRTGTGTVFNQLLKFAADGNSISACSDSESLQYFCCRPISAL